MENRRADSFDTFAADYDHYRPTYSWPSLAPFLQKAGIKAGANLLEIGCGSGQATRALVGRGFKIVAVDPGQALLILAAQKLPRDEVTLVSSRFEDFRPIEGCKKFDFAFAVTSFHWVDQKIGYELLHSLLNDGALFANINLSKIWPQRLRNDLDRLYAAFEHEFDQVHTIHGKSESRIDETEAARFFLPPEPVVSAFDVEYSADSYVGLMKTMSDHRLLPPDVQRSFYEELHRVCSNFGSFYVHHKLTAKLYRKMYKAG